MFESCNLTTEYRGQGRRGVRDALLTHGGIYVGVIVFTFTILHF
jgi:hypothetical protein